MASQGLISADSGKPTGAETPADALEVIQRMSTSDAESQESYECPTCGDECANYRGMKIHHQAAHGESIAGEIGECDWCGSTFRRERWMLEGGNHTFCDHACKAKWQSENIAGENHPLYNKQTVECSWCQSELKRTPYQIDQNSRHFCDRECRAEWESESGHMAKANNPNWEGGTSRCLTVECTVCGDECDRRRSMVAENTTGCHFCSPECHGEWMSENWVGEKHPTWDGGELEYGPGWTQPKREAVRERDDHRCQACGMTQREHSEQFGAKLHVHHIKPARTFDDPTTRNAMENLVTFCRSCHMKWEGIPLRPEIVS